MNAVNTPDTQKSSAPLVASFVLSLPALVAFGAALSLAHGEGSLFSAQWFIYEASRQVALIGIAVTVIMMITLAMRHASRSTMLWMTANVAYSATFLWWAHHLAAISQ